MRYKEVVEAKREQLQELQCEIAQMTWNNKNKDTNGSSCTPTWDSTFTLFSQRADSAAGSYHPSSSRSSFSEKSKKKNIFRF